MLDKLPPALRHLIFAMAGAVLSVLAADLDGLGLPEGAKALLGAALPVIVAAVTPLTKQYGVGSEPAAAEDLG